MKKIISITLREKGFNTKENRSIIIFERLRGQERTKYTDNYLNDEFMNGRPVLIELPEERTKEFVTEIALYNSSIFDVKICS
ncbi:MAG: hypothetical protein FWB95_05015 [Treponema sp.]|nr:hypothetical protein [Treponema sp.]